MNDKLSVSPEEAKRLILSGSAPDGLIVTKTLRLVTENVTALPDNLYIGGTLNLYGCNKLRELPQGLIVEGTLILAGCKNISFLPDDLWAGEGLCLNSVNEAIIQNTPLEKLGKYNILWSTAEYVGDIPVPAIVFKHPERLTPKEIMDERNLATRRIMIERYGIENFFGELDAGKINEDSEAALYRADSWDGEPLVIVHAYSDDLDDTVYFLRVPPHITTVQEAFSWGFRNQAGFYPEEYYPKQK